MATAPAVMTIEQYLHTSFSPDVDFVDGEIKERNVGEKDHARLQSLISAIFVAKEEQYGFESCTEQRIQVSDDRVRICDFTLVSERAPYEEVLRTAPVLCIEIMSPEDRLSRVLNVLHDYRAMGVQDIWLIDPQERLAYTFGSDGLQQQQDLKLTGNAAGASLDVEALFAKMDRSRNKETA
jgi:Uma2 family endonuclease